MFPLINTPKGGRIHVLRVPVNPERDWTEAADAAGPDTARFDIPIRSSAIGKNFSGGGQPREIEVILVNFGDRTLNTLTVARWSYRFGLADQGPRVIFAIGEHHPDLPSELGVSSSMDVVSTSIFKFNDTDYMSKVEWHEGGRGIGMMSLSATFNSRSWFAFNLNIQS